MLGVDGSGKSTFLRGLKTRFNYEVLEPTSTPEARALKVANLKMPIDGDLIDQRERVFLELNHQFDRVLSQDHAGERAIATTGSALVTLVSHGLMRVIIGEKNEGEVSESVERWVNTGAQRPDRVVLVHAQDSVIRQRILERQQAGNQSEHFWGFNSPYFLSRYQETLHHVVDLLGCRVAADCLKLDSSTQTPLAMIDAYGDHFNIST